MEYLETETLFPHLSILILSFNSFGKYSILNEYLWKNSHPIFSWILDNAFHEIIPHSSFNIDSTSRLFYKIFNSEEKISKTFCIEFRHKFWIMLSPCWEFPHANSGKLIFFFLFIDMDTLNLFFWWIFHFE